jgi:hypothetical protein
MKYTTERFVAQRKDVCSRPAPSDAMYAEAAAGRHQKLLRLPDGHHELVIRDAPGVYRHVPVLAFEGGFQV